MSLTRSCGIASDKTPRLRITHTTCSNRPGSISRIRLTTPFSIPPIPSIVSITWRMRMAISVVPFAGYLSDTAVGWLRSSRGLGLVAHHALHGILQPIGAEILFCQKAAGQQQGCRLARGLRETDFVCFVSAKKIVVLHSAFDGVADAPTDQHHARAESSGRRLRVPSGLVEEGILSVPESKDGGRGCIFVLQKIQPRLPAGRRCGAELFQKSPHLRTAERAGQVHIVPMRNVQLNHSVEPVADLLRLRHHLDAGAHFFQKIARIAPHLVAHLLAQAAQILLKSRRQLNKRAGALFLEAKPETPDFGKGFDSAVEIPSYGHFSGDQHLPLGAPFPKKAQDG